MAKFSIFISHKVRVEQDRAAAEKLKTILRTPFARNGKNDVLDVHISEEIVPGQTWLEWIKSSLEGSNLLLLLFTDPTLHWDWCLYEAGLFTDLDTAFHGVPSKGKSVVFIYPEDRSEPDPLRHLQGVKATKPAIEEFLRDLFWTNKYGCEPSLADELGNKKDQLDLPKLASEVLEALNFAEPKTTTFGIHLDLEAKSADSLNASTIAPDVVVSGDKDACGLFGRAAGDHRWGDFEDHARLSHDKKWIEELAGALSLASQGKSFRPVRSTFRPISPEPEYSISREYLPCVEQMTNLRNKSLRFSIFFSEQPTMARTITSFDELIDELENLIETTPQGEVVKMICLTPALGFLAKPEKWDQLKACFVRNQGKLRMTCLDKPSLKRWHRLFVWRRNASGVIKKDDTDKATAAAEALLNDMQPRRVGASKMPDFYVFSDEKRAILVTPLFLPRLGEPAQPKAVRESLLGVEMFGIVTNYPTVMNQIKNIHSFYSGGRAYAAGN